MRKSVILIALGLIISAQCIFAGGNQEVQMYVNEEVGFSIAVPADYTEEATISPQEIKRFVAPNDYKVPVFTVNLRERTAGSELADIPGKIVSSMEQTIPGTSQYKIHETSEVELNDGSDAHMVMFEFLWMDGETVMESVILAAFKEDRLITVSGTTVRGLGVPLNELSKICSTLKLSS